MLSIFAVACLWDQPGQCKDVELSFAEGSGSMFECAMYGQFELAKWSEAQPKWRIAKWRCGRSGEMAKI